MTDGGDGASGAPGDAGGPVRHVPVLLHEVVAALRPAAGDLIIDGTFGAGGYSSALLEAGAEVIAIDRDPQAIAIGRELQARHAGRLHLHQGTFSELDAIAREAGFPSVDGVVLDVGVSSMQLDEAGRGFSFRQDGPLDMRMAQSGLSAADVVNGADHATLTRIFGILGEERHASRLARAVAEARKTRVISTTLQLANIIEGAIGRRSGDRIHPATRAFQGLRIFVNGELHQLADALFSAERVLKPGGRLAVVSFHSLEDRIVKRFFQDRAGQASTSRHLPQGGQAVPTFAREQRGSVTAGEAELAANPRARSAKLRSGIRTEAPPRAADPALFKLPNLSTDQVTSRA
ncbi:MAG: 16S rRNA (cytosine(1402)-N(4))-methyltransferase RsmH [Nitratireductor sp.]|nr:16S rRNA (cytosine(1402)-N(4))-methyltransferase RsmH [Nitratireductor sp.]